MNNENKQWVEVPGYDGRYIVSDQGEVVCRNWHNTGVDMLLPRNINSYTGYVTVSMTNPNEVGKYKTKNMLLHRIVMMSFQPTDDKTLQVDHINNNRQDCRLCNLRWITRKENNSRLHARRMKSVNSAGKSHGSEFIKATKEGETKYFYNQADAANQIGCSKVLVTKALSKNDKVVQCAMGWKLEYVPKEHCPKHIRETIDKKSIKLNQITTMKNKLKEQKKILKGQMMKEVKNRIDELKTLIKEKVSEYKKTISSSEDLLKEISTLKLELEKTNFSIKKWDLHAVIQYDLEGNVIKEWKSVSQVKKELGLDVNKAVKSNDHEFSGFVWKYKIAR